ncbi:MAG TPA: hypothetical protein VHD91_03015 [Gaiellaceae bacterium]|nr:hypothetical protein [Gaiellaceae bacterium]
MAEVSVVVCMDTEGPCADPGDPELLADWERVDAAMDKLFDPEFRRRVPDSAGGGLRIGWFFLTWTGFRTNPRGRAFGYHAIRDHYLARWGDDLAALGDEQCWHYHQPPASGIGNEWSADWGSSDEFDRIVSRQLFERDWFPSCYRAGGTIMSSESSRWVDAWFPVDYSNRAPIDVPGLVDWAPAPADWSLYHPDPEDFRRPGAGHRLMARCLDLRTSIHAFAEADVVAAFERARSGRPAILSTFDHDYRDIRGRLESFQDLLASTASRYEDVPWRYASPVEAVRGYLGASQPEPVRLSVRRENGSVLLEASAPAFQAIPWIAVAAPDGEIRSVREGVVRLALDAWRWTPAGEWREAAFGISTPHGMPAVARLAA